MGKPEGTARWNSRKDSFFVGKGKKNSKPGNKRTEGGKEELYSQHSVANAGSFFVTPSEKQQILQEKEAKKNWKGNFKPGRERKEKKSEEEKPKKLFDKKKWRLQKYSKKYKLEQWEEKRKKAVLHQYYKQVKDDEPKFDVQKIYEQYKDDEGDDDDDNKQEVIENENNLNRNIREEQGNTANTKEGSERFDVRPSTSQTKQKKKAFKKAHLEYQRIRDEKKQRKEEIAKKKVEKAEALKEYKQKKLEKYKKLNKKTKKGQPIMKYRMEMLLEQIQKGQVL